MNKKEQLEKLKTKIDNELECPLKDSARNMVFGKGNPEAKIMFIGEAPGAKEDEQGIPFVGAAGRELDKLLHSIGLSIEETYIANILKYRPPNNRDPQTDEIQRHTPYLIEQIEIIQPSAILTLGNFSTKFIVGGFTVQGMKSVEGITKLHGNTREIKTNGKHFTVVPMYHPAAMLYRPQLREIIEEDFGRVKQIIDTKKSQTTLQ